MLRPYKGVKRLGCQRGAVFYNLTTAVLHRWYKTLSRVGHISLPLGFYGASFPDPSSVAAWFS